MTMALALAALPLLAVLGLGLGSLRRGHVPVYAGALLAAGLLAAQGLGWLLSPDGAVAWSAHLPLGLPWIGLHLKLDTLSAFFLLVVNLPAALAALFAIGYGDHIPEHRRVTPLFPLFLLGMNLVLVADDAFGFLLGWEFMSLTSWLMVLSDHRNAKAREAARIYLIMAVFGTLCLLPAFGLLAGTAGDFTFAALRATPLEGAAGFLVVLLVLLGAGSKAGLVPLHAWLPLAHPAAPSHVSALMSGVMTKVALYGMIRLLMDLHGGVGWPWGLAMMLVGGITAVLGILYALLQTDLKTMLAYSTVENIGVMVTGLGLALAFQDQAQAVLASLALVAVLYHALNHALFKSLLFLGTGAVLQATGEKEMNRLGGLMKRMPWTGGAFLVGAAAISSLPPLNGFVSEWLIFQSLFKGPSLPHWAMKFGVPVVGALLALAAALAAACFVRAVGVAFLGRPRSLAAAQAAEPPLSLRASMLVLAGLCVFLGVIPVTISGLIALVAQSMTGVQLPVSVGLGWPWLSPVSEVGGSYSATMMMLTGLALTLTIVLALRLFGSLKTRRAPAWDCGAPVDLPDTQYTAESFSQPLRRVFGASLFGAREAVDMPEPGELRPARFTLRLVDPVWQGLYLPIGRAVLWLAERVNHMQFFTVRTYLTLMFATLVVLLCVVAVRQ